MLYTGVSFKESEKCVILDFLWFCCCLVLDFLLFLQISLVVMQPVMFAVAKKMANVRKVASAKANAIIANTVPASQ